MYNETKLFEIEKDKLIYQNENKFCQKKYQKEIGAVLHREKRVPYFTFSSFSEYDFIRHGFSTRLGGVSEGKYSTLNLSYSRGDEEKAVTKNYHLICESMGMDTKDIVFSDQVHDTVVYRASKKDCQENVLEHRKLSGIDGLVTNEKNVVLCTSYADCVPLFFVDAKNKAIGLSHSGWKGTVGKIGKKTVETMQQEFGSRPEEIHCVIGPSICVNCYEVSQDVIEQVQENVTEEVFKDCVYNKGNGKYQLDLWMLNRYILMEAGVLEENIKISNVCTCCNHTLMFSHRASGGKRGNLCGFLEIYK